MIVLSWDIGISNLSWCLMGYYPEEGNNGRYDIYDWDVINFMNPDDNKKIILCQGIIASGKNKGSVCGSSAFYIDENSSLCFCKKHNPNKEKKSKKKERKPKKKKTKKNIPLHTLASSLSKRLDGINLLNNRPVDVILIESQPKIATASVKHVMDFLLCYLTIRSIDKKITPKIITISAKRKLSIYNGPPIKCTIKDAHSRNKFLGIAYCRYMLDNSLTNEEEEPFYSTPDWILFFESIKKKDDLADSFLQGAWYLRENS